MSGGSPIPLDDSVGSNPSAWRPIRHTEHIRPPRHTHTHTHTKTRAVVALGTCVQTASGAGVVVGFRRAAASHAAPAASPSSVQPRHVYLVRLWNRIGCDGSVRLLDRLNLNVQVVHS